jgi:perosamine synthetase
VATTSGTAALHTALLVAGVEAEDEVLVSTLTFIAPANAIRYAGAWPVFIDAEETTGQMDPARVAEFLEGSCVRRGGVLRNSQTGRRVRAILPVDVFGHPVDADPIRELARGHGLVVVEDATEALGASYKGRPAGRLSDIACFSFNGNKIVTTGGGGMIVTDDARMAERARYLTTQAKDDPIEFVHGAVGFNYRLTNVLAAVGVAQMERLEEFVDRKRAIAARYGEALGSLPGLTMVGEAAWARASFWMSNVRVDSGRFGMGSRDLLRRLEEARIQARPLWQPIHRSPAHAGGIRVGGEVADRWNREALTLPCSVGLTEEQQTRVIQAVTSAAGGGV